MTLAFYSFNTVPFFPMGWCEIWGWRIPFKEPEIFKGNDSLRNSLYTPRNVWKSYAKFFILLGGMYLIYIYIDVGMCRERREIFDWNCM